MDAGKRRYQRFSVDKLGMHSTAVFASDIEVSDINLLGARIKSTERPRVGSDYLIKFVKEGTLSPLKCTVVWEKLSETIQKTDGESIPVFAAGIEFRDINSDRMYKLRDFIGRFTLTDEQRFAYEKGLQGVRFKIHAREMALLCREENYTVKKISLCGMLIETGAAMKVDKQYPMELFLPNDNFPISFTGRFASCIPVSQKTEDRFNAGIEFIDISENDRSRLSNFILFSFGYL